MLDVFYKLMWFYFFFLFFIILLCGRYNIIQGHYFIPKQAGYKISVLFIIFVTSFRFNIGYDWSSYLNFIYPTFNPLNINRLEPLDKLIISCAGYLNQPLVMFSVYAIITYANIGILIHKYSVSNFESLMIYVCLFYLTDLSTIRQAIAVSVVFYGFTFIEQRKFLKYFLVCIVAVLFHKSAVIALLFYHLYYAKPMAIVFIMVSIYTGMKVVLPKILGSILPLFMLYLEKGGIKDSSGSFQRLFYLILFIYALVFHRKKSVGLVNICAVGVALPFVLGGHTGGRLAQYFLIYYCLLLPECNKRFNINYRILFMIPFYAYFFMYLIVSVTANHSDEYVPFRWYFLEDLNQKLM